MNYQFDGLGLISTATEGGRTLLSEIHDELGLPLTRGTNRSQHRLEYDAYGRLRFDHVAVTAKQESTVEYRWDGNDRLHILVDGASHSTTQTFDGLDRIYQSTNGIGTSTFDYFSGTPRMHRALDPAGTSTRYVEDDNGRPIEIDTVDGPGLSKPGFSTSRFFAYTQLGDIESATVQDPEHSAIVTFKYDSLRRKRSESTDTAPFSLTRDYSRGDPTTPRQTTSTLSFGATSASLIRTFDPLGRIANIALNGSSVAQYQYVRGALDHITFGNGVTQSMSYDDHARLAGTTVSRDQSPLASLTEGLGDDDVPRMRRRQVASLAPLTDLFKTDLAGRVTDENLSVPGVAIPAGNITNETVTPLWSVAQPSSTFNLDGAANWASRSGVGAFMPTIDAANRYTALDSAPVSYDGAGNTTAVSGESYTWDGLGKLKTAFVAGSTLQFRYDALGRRIVELKSGKTTNLLWDGGAIIVVGGPDQSGTRLRIFDENGISVALIAQSGRGPPTYVHSAPDHSAFVATDSSGKLAEAYSYSSFGDTTAIDPNTGAARNQPIVPFLFQGQLRESFNSSYLMGAREYRPAWGRFLSPDPVGIAAALSLYALVGGQPLTYWDPSGLSGVDSRLSGTFPRDPREAIGRMVAIAANAPRMLGDLGLWAITSPYVGPLCLLGCSSANAPEHSTILQPTPSFGAEVVNYGVAVGVGVGFSVAASATVGGFRGAILEEPAPRNLVDVSSAGGSGAIEGNRVASAPTAGPAENPASGAPQDPLYGPFQHTLNKGGLQDIMENQRMLSSEARQIAGAAAGVRAYEGELDMSYWPDVPNYAYSLSEYDQTTIEFMTTQKPNVNPASRVASWPVPAGEYLQIILTKVRIFLSY